MIALEADKTAAARVLASPPQAKSRFDTTVEELERILILKEGGSLKDATMQNGAGGSSSGGSGSDGKKKFGKLGGGLFKNKNPVQVRRFSCQQQRPADK